MERSSKSVKISVVVTALRQETDLFDTLSSIGVHSNLVDDVYVICPDAFLFDYRKYGIARIVHIRDHGLGIYQAMNMMSGQCGLEEFIIFLNAGDVFIGSEYFVQAREMLTLDPTIDALASGYVTKLRTKKNPILARFLGAREVAASIKPKRMRQCAFLFRACRLKELGGFETELSIAADYQFFLRFSQNWKIVRINCASSIFYLDGKSSNSRVESLRQQFIVSMKYAKYGELRKLFEYALFALKMVRAWGVDCYTSAGFLRSKK